MRWQSQICKDISDKSKKLREGKAVSSFDDGNISGKNFFYISFLVVSSSVLHSLFFSLIYLNISLIQGSKILNSTEFGESTSQEPEPDFLVYFFPKKNVLSMLNPSPTEVSGKIPNALLPWEQDLAWQGWTVAKPTTSHPWRSSQGSSNQNNSFAVLSL